MSDSEASHVAVRYVASAGSQKSGTAADEKGCALKPKEQAQRERETRKNGSSSAMEVDQGDQESEMPTAPKHFLGTPHFNHRNSGGEARKDNGTSASTGAREDSSLGPSLPTAASPYSLGQNFPHSPRHHRLQEQFGIHTSLMHWPRKSKEFPNRRKRRTSS